MNHISFPVIPAIVAAVLALPAAGDTVFQGGSINTAGDWNNSLPAPGNPGSIAVDGTTPTSAPIR